MTEFEGVISALGQALTKRGYDQLTPVQLAVLAPELKNADALVSAQTGSGKTVAFGMAIAPTLLDGADYFAPATAPLALAVAPTRELAIQVKRELDWLFEMTGAKVTSCVGGMDMRTERRALDQGAHIVVGTPGRLRDHIERGSFDTSRLRAVVLDEADEMLDLGFREDLEYILEAAPEERRTLMFSATVPRSIASLAKRYQKDAIRISTAAEQKQHGDIDYRALTVAPNDRENAIINVLRYYEAKNALVFCATRATVAHMTSRFTNRGFSVVALSGELSQNERTHALQAMRDGRARVCIATDVAARGIDLPNLELVIHADIPKSRETLLHRSGRTGRAGRKGTCALIIPHNWRRRTERLLESANIEATWAKPPSVDEVMARDRERVLADPVLTEPLTEFEQAFAKELLEQHGPEQVAAAFLRKHLSEQTAPEELIDAAPPEKQKRQREDFTNGVWLTLSVGREQNAEPRWLLPMLCRAGHVTKREIGSIRIQQNETHVELSPEVVDRFLKAIGPDGKVEDNVVAKRLEGEPGKPSREGPRKTYDDRKPHRKNPHRKNEGGPRKGPKREFHKVSDRIEGSSESPKVSRNEVVKERFEKDKYEPRKPKPSKKGKKAGPSDAGQKFSGKKPKRKVPPKGGATPLKRKRS